MPTPADEKGIFTVNSFLPKALALLLTTGWGAPFAWSDTLKNTAIITDTVFSGGSGLAAVNQSGGDSNAQTTVRIYAGGGNAQKAKAEYQITQTVHHQSGERRLFAESIIENKPFNDYQGVVSVSQTSGVANVQANGLVIVVGKVVELAGHAELSASVISPDVAPEEEPDRRRMHGMRARTFLSDDAFTGTRGIVQLNQTAGAANETANGIALQYLVRD